MKIFHASNHSPKSVDRRTFSGNATMARIDGLIDSPRVNVYRVVFQPSSRTAWHTHVGGPQLLLVIDGICLAQKAGESIFKIRPGGAVRIEPGERHWHGATPEAPMTHLAINVEASTEWHDKVTDEEYFDYENSSA